MIAVASIVEGHGEVKALPILLSRLNTWKTADSPIQILTPIRIRRDRFLNREEEFRRHLLLAAGKCGQNGWILLLLDADDDCPAKLAKEILERAQKHVSHRRVSVVLANREYEAWFIAAGKSLNGQRGFEFPEKEMIDAERPRNAKDWISKHMPTGAYRETIDQPAFSALMDLEQAFENSRSFRKLCHEWQRQATSSATI